MVTISINNNFCFLTGEKKMIVKLYNAYKFRHPQAFFLRRHMPKGWDGMYEIITDTGKFKTGLLPRVLKTCEEFGIETILKEKRPDKENIKGVITDQIKEFARDYQLEAIETVVTHRVKKLRFPRGAIKAATNAGKTAIGSGIYLAYNQPTILLLNSKELFEDALVDIPKFIGKRVGQISAKKIEWANYMVCMVSTLKARLKDKAIENKLAQYRVLIVDEADLADNKTYKTVLQKLYNTIVRVAMSGTIFVSKLAKDNQKNFNLEGFFGPTIYDITNRKLIDKGHSSEVQVKFVMGNKLNIKFNTYAEEYDALIVHNKARNKKAWKRSKWHYDKGRTNQLILAQRHEHIKNLYDVFRKNYPPEVTIEWVHHSRKDRTKIVNAFKEGKIDILIGSNILKRGKNFPLMKYQLNWGGGKGEEGVLQGLGRSFRGCEFFEDSWDLGLHLIKHSRKRYRTYKNEKIVVLNKYKNVTI